MLRPPQRLRLPLKKKWCLHKLYTNLRLPQNMRLPYQMRLPHKMRLLFFVLRKTLNISFVWFSRANWNDHWLFFISSTPEWDILLLNRKWVSKFLKCPVRYVKNIWTLFVSCKGIIIEPCECSWCTKGNLGRLGLHGGHVVGNCILVLSTGLFVWYYYSNNPLDHKHSCLKHKLKGELIVVGGR